MDRRTLVLGLVAVAAVAAAVVVLVTGRTSASPEHKAVAKYIENVDLIKQQMQVPLTKSVNAYRDFSTTGRVSKKLRPQLVAAERTLRRLERRLSALPAPASAAQLRELLVRLVRLEVGLAGEVTRLADFLPRFAALLRTSLAAGKQLSRSLTAIKTPHPRPSRGTKKQVAAAQAEFNAATAAAAGKQADAVEAYDNSIEKVRRQLMKLEPPPVLVPTYRVQLRTLKASAAAGVALARELRSSDRSQLNALGRRFTEAARIAGSVGAQKAEIAAIKAYNGRVRAIAKVQDRIRNELTRLQQKTG